MERLTRPLRYPNNVPVTLDVLWCGSATPKPGLITGILHAMDDVVKIGKERNTVRRTLKTFDLFFFFFEDGGSMRLF